MANPDDDDYVFLDRHVPTLTSGAYTVRNTLTVTVDGQSTVYPRSVEFWVGGQRFSLAPADVHSRYPPDGSCGAYQDCLPHIALKRDTLPWERSADDAGAPWLALLVLDAGEAARCPLRSVPLATYRSRFSEPPPLEPGQSDDDQILVLELDAALWATLVPTKAELETLCHVRGRLARDGETGDDAPSARLVDSVAVVVSKRLPPAGRCTAHLVSLERRYLGATDAPTVVVSLQRWSFTCEPAVADSKPPLADLFRGLAPGWLRIPLPAHAAPEAEPYLARGRAPLPHRFRSGESGVSWYAGPLVPGPVADVRDELVALPASCSDELAWYHEDIGMLDITYAAARELGVLLALRHPGVTAALADLRRQQILAARRESAHAGPHGHLPQLQRGGAPAIAGPDSLIAWMRGLWRLEGIPFKYLVPDERMLPTESIRCVSLDRRWIAALLDGALGLARPPAARKQGTRSAVEAEMLAFVDPGIVSGFLLRSQVGSGWAELEIAARDRDKKRLDVHQSVRLSPSIVMHLFAGEARTITLEQHRSTVHLTVKQPAWADETARVLQIEPGLRSAELARSMLDQAQSLELTLVVPP